MALLKPYRDVFTGVLHSAPYNLSARVFLDLNEAGFDLGFYAFCVEVEFGADFGLGTVLDELVGESELQDRNRQAFVGEIFQYSTASATGCYVFFNGD